MIKTLRESKAKLSELVERASRGEDILITVRGKVKARLTRAGGPGIGEDTHAWVEQLRALQEATSTRQGRLSTEQLIAEDRESRV